MDTNEELSQGQNIAAESCPPVEEPPAFVRMPFPTAALPRVLRTFVEDASQALGVPPECVAAPVLATCAAAIGNTRRVRISSTWTEPCVLWVVTLLESGSLKTPAYNAAVEPLRAMQRKHEESFITAMEDYKKKKADFDADFAYWSKQNREGRTNDPAPIEPEEPVPIDLFTSDSTVEALALLFAKNPRGLALTRDELTGFFGSFGAYKGGRGADEATYLEFYNAGCVKLNRASGKRLYVHRAALTIFGTCQPSVFLKAIGATGTSSTNQVENGLAARFIVTAPQLRPKKWREIGPINDVAYQKLIMELLTIPMATNEDGQPEPGIVSMMPSAVTVFSQFVNEHGQHTAKIEKPALRYHYAKLEAIAARLALIFHLCNAASKDHESVSGVSAEETKAGITLARWFGREAMRVYAFYENEHQKEEHDLLDLVRDYGGVITPREMARAKEKWRRDHSAAELALRNLARLGYGTIVLDDRGGNVGRPCLRFHLTTGGVRDTIPGKFENNGIVSREGSGDYAGEEGEP